MPWYAWLAVGAVASCAAMAAAFFALRTTERGRRFLRLPTRGKLRFLRTLLLDPSIPRPARLIMSLVLVYLALPFDLVPDFIPILGQADDVLLVLLVIAAILALLPPDTLERAFLGAEDRPGATDEGADGQHRGYFTDG